MSYKAAFYKAPKRQVEYLWKRMSGQIKAKFYVLALVWWKPNTAPHTISTVKLGGRNIMVRECFSSCRAWGL